MVSLPIFLLPGRPLPILHCPEDPHPPEQIEGHLPAEGVDDVLDDSGKSGAKGIAMQMAQPEVLLHNVTLLDISRFRSFS